MKKAELVEVMPSNAGLTKADSRKALDAFIGAITKSLRNGNIVALAGFGYFSISKRKVKTSRNPPKQQLTPVFSLLNSKLAQILPKRLLKI